MEETKQTCSTCEYHWPASTTGRLYCGVKKEDGSGVSECTPEEIKMGCFRWEEGK
jgi:hypothetical protein